MDNKLIGNENNIIFYNDEDGQTKIEVILQNENVWLNIESLTKLFKIDRTGITRHINNIYKDEELEENSTSAKIAQVQKEGNIPMYMEDWKDEVDNVLKMRHYKILEGKGKISKLDADKKASKEYEKYKVKQDRNYISDFDKLTQETKKLDDKK